VVDVVGIVVFDIVGVVFVGVVTIVITAGVVVVGSGGGIIAKHAGIVVVEEVVDECVNVHADDTGVTVIQRFAGVWSTKATFDCLPNTPVKDDDRFLLASWMALTVVLANLSGSNEDRSWWFV
jgi:hypothetical protein